MNTPISLNQDTLEEFTVFWEQFAEEMRIRADAIFDEMWEEIHG